MTVATTGIYCREGCPAPSPKRANTGLVPTVEAARAAGYRACKRCRPDDAAERTEAGSTDVYLIYRGRRRLDSLLAFLGARAVAGIEVVEVRSYVRTMRLGHGPAVMRLELEPGRVRCRVLADHPDDAAEGIALARRLLDLERDLAAVDEVLLRDPLLARLMNGRRGTAVPGSVDGFELAVRAILGQQVSVAGARTLAGRLVAAFGHELPLRDEGPTRLFPSPERLSDADVASIGMPKARADAIGKLSGLVADGSLDLTPGADPETTRAALLAVPGVGPWTASYVAMRVLRDPDAFLPSDLGVRKAMVRLGVQDKPGDIQARAEAWRPWRAYALQYLWASLGDAATAG